MKKQILLFILFLFVLLSKNVLFHVFAFDWAMPWGEAQFWFSKLSVAVILASFVFITRRPWWTIAALVIVDIWSIVNWLYFQSYGLFVSFSMINLAGNLNGFADAIWAYVDGRVPLFLLPSVLYIIAVCLLPRRYERQWTMGGIICISGLSLVVCSNILIHEVRREKGYDDGPLTVRKTLPLYVDEQKMLQDWESTYSLVRDHSIIEYMPLHVVYEHKLKAYRQSSQDALSEQEQTWMNQLYRPQKEASVQTPNSHLVLIVVESLETWPLYYEGITPHMNALRHHPHSLYADKIFSQIRYGMSADGQLIINTGLLPIQSGVASILYGDNIYPNFAHMYPRSSVFNPSKGTWNKSVMMPAFGYKELYEPESISEETWWNDLDLCTQAGDWLTASDSLSCTMVLTVSSHAPFDKVDIDVPAITPDAPTMMRRYLSCIHYADSCIGLLLDTLAAHGRMANTTVVITSDHIFFHGSRRRDFVPYAQAHGLPISEWNYNVPLIVYAPAIAAGGEVNDQCYQMDIFPTILHAIGCSSYAWQGLGIDLYQPATPRILYQDDAYHLSDKLIRNNWFAPSIL